MKWLFSPILSFISLSIISSCQIESVKPSASGRPGELVIVIDSTVWQGPAGDIIRDSLMCAYPAIPQYEPTFTIVTIDPSGFRNILKNHRNILIIDVGPISGDGKYSLTYKRDVWSTPQLVLNLRVSGMDEMETAVRTMAASIRDKFTSEEQSRMVGEYHNSRQSVVSKKISDMMHIQMHVKDDYIVAKESDSYMWIRKETIHTSIGIQLQRLPYFSDKSFDPVSILNVRDSLCKKYIEGPTSGSFMTTEYNFPWISTQTTLDSCYTIEISGLWKVEGDFMGGPFRTWLIHDRINQSLLFVDAYVYAPKFNKREYVKDLESLVYSIRFR